MKFEASEGVSYIHEEPVLTIGRPNRNDNATVKQTGEEQEINHKKTKETREYFETMKLKEPRT